MPASAKRSLVRKQLSVTHEQDRALKRRSRELGVSEAELVRRALDAALAPEDRASGLASPLELLLSQTRDLSGGRSLNAPFRRDDLYEDRGGSGEESCEADGESAKRT